MLHKTDKDAKWELQIFDEDGATIEIRYFSKYEDAERYGDEDGNDYEIYANK